MIAEVIIKRGGTMKLKTGILIAAMMMITSSAFSNITAPTSLKSAMKQMNSTLKVISDQSGDSSKNADSAKLADDFIALAESCKNFIPRKVQNLPPAQQQAQVQNYNLDVDDMIALGKNLASAFRSNDNVGAVKILNDLNTTKKDGHAKFK